MSNYAVEVQELGKRYRIGAERVRYKTFRESLSSSCAKAMKSVRALVGSGNGSVDTNPSDFWAVNDISFSVKHGEVVGIIGRNGAGKSTLLKLLSRITAPTRGEASINGRLGSLLEVGTGFHPELTGRENIYLNGAILGLPASEIDRKFDEIVAFAEVERFLDTPVKRYSSGMQLRLGFSVAAHLEPDILVVDEVLAVGDAAFQRKCIGKMQAVAGASRTVLFVSHNIPAIQSLCDRVILLNQGRVDFDGSVEAGAKRYFELQESLISGDLAGRTDRIGSHRARFVDVRANNASGASTGVVRCGENVELLLDYVGAPGDRLERVQVGIDFVSTYDQRVLNLTTTWTDSDFEVLPSKGSLSCQVPKFPLMPGRYTLDLFLSINGETADYVRSAIVLEVAAGDYYGTGKLPSLGQFMTEHRWAADVRSGAHRGC